MSLNRFLICRQFFSAKSCYNAIKLRLFSTVPKSDSSKIQEIKKFVINQNKNNLKPNEVNKPVLLYSNENHIFFRRLFIINVCQSIFWIYLANIGIALALKKHNFDDKNEENKENIILRQLKVLWTQHSTQFLLALSLLFCGQISVSLFTFFTIRSIRYIILSPNQQKVRITTFSISGSPNRFRNYDIPLENVSALQNRNSGGNFIPLKIKGKWFYYLVDSKGNFHKPALFDQTVGVFRILK